jgi:hypothetical protein
LPPSVRTFLSAEAVGRRARRRGATVFMVSFVWREGIGEWCTCAEIKEKHREFLGSRTGHTIPERVWWRGMLKLCRAVHDLVKAIFLFSQPINPAHDIGSISDTNQIPVQIEPYSKHLSYHWSASFQTPNTCPTKHRSMASVWIW